MAISGLLTAMGSAEIAALRAENTQLRATMSEVLERLDMLERAQRD